MVATVQQRFERDAALLDALLTEAPVGLAFFGRDLRLLRVNATLADLHGVPVSAHTGRTAGELLPGVGEQVSAGLQAVLRTARAVKDTELAAGGGRTWLCSWYPVHEGEEVVALGAVVLDVTDRVRAERRTAFLGRVGELLSASLEWDETLRHVAEVAVPSKADLCVVHVQDEAGRVQRLVGVHGDPVLQEALDEAGERWWLGGGAAAEAISGVLRSGVPVFLPSIGPADVERSAVDREHHLLLRRLDVTSLLIVPLSAGGRITGSLSFAMSGSGRRFDDEDFELAVEIARRAAVAVDNARLYRERDHIARTLQRSLLPAQLPEVPGFELAARFRPAGQAFAVGGDFYDVVPVPGGWSIVVGDVCGKGPEAAALTALARYTLRAAHRFEPAPARVLELLNDTLLDEDDDDRFLTVAAARLEGSRLDVAIAGQSPVLHVRADGSVAGIGRPGRVVGIAPDLDLVETSIELEPGDAVVLFTDGLTDAGAPARLLDAEELGTFAARVLPHGAAAVADSLENRALAVASGHPRDDIAVVVLRRCP